MSKSISYAVKGLFLPNVTCFYSLNWKVYSLDKRMYVSKNHNLELYLQKMETDEGDRMEIARTVIARREIADMNSMQALVLKL